MPYITVDVDVGLDEFDTDDLWEELRRRGACSDTLPEGFDPVEGKSTVELAEACFEARRRGDGDRALELIDRLIYAALGRII